MNRIRKIVAMSGLALMSTGTLADISTTNIFLTGDQEVPGVSSSSLGAAQFSYDTDSQTFDLDMMVFGITLADLMPVGPNNSPVHIHLAPPGANGGIVIDLGVVGSFVNDGLGIRYQVFDQLLGGATGAISSDVNANEAALVAGNLYINIHTESNPGGELRGQITGVIPSPASVALLGLGGLIAARRRRA